MRSPSSFDRQQRQILPDLVGDLFLRRSSRHCHRRSPFGRNVSERRAGCHTGSGRLNNRSPRRTHPAGSNDDNAATPHDRNRASKPPAGRRCWSPRTGRLPTPGAGEILVQGRGRRRQPAGHACSARGSIRRRRARRDIPGLEIAGEVVALGRGVKRWKIGDKVMALVVGGGYAQYCLAHESHALPVPSGYSMVEAAAIPETFFTVWHNVFERGGLKSRRDAAGAWRLVRHRHDRDPARQGLRRARHRHRRLRRKNATPAASSAPTSPSTTRARTSSPSTKEATGGKGADVILDMVGGDYIERNYEAAAVEGRIVQIAFQGSPKATVDFRRIMLKRLHHTGSTLRSRSRRRQGRDRAGDRGKGLAAVVVRPGQAGDRLHLPAGEGGRRPCPHGDERPYRQDRADPVRRPASRGREIGAIFARLYPRAWMAHLARPVAMPPGRERSLDAETHSFAVCLRTAALTRSRSRRCSASRPPRAVDRGIRAHSTPRPSISPTRPSISAREGDRIQVSTAPGPDGIVRRIEVRAREGSSNWAVFALANTSDEQIDRLIVVPHYRLVGSGLFWPDLGLSRIATITPSRRRAARAAGERRPPTSSASRSIPARSSPSSPNCAPTSCRSSICGSPTPTRTRSTPSRSITASSSALPACSRCS